MNQILLIAQFIISTLLIIAILLQQRGSSLGSAFGGSGTSYTSRRGTEKHIFRASIVLTIIFIVLAVFNFLA